MKYLAFNLLGGIAAQGQMMGKSCCFRDLRDRDPRRCKNNFFARIIQAADSLHALQLLTVGRIDLFAARKGPVYVFQLQQSQRRIEFAHLSVDAGRYHSHFIHKTEVLQLVDPLLCLGVTADDSSAFKGVEYFSCVEAQNR